VDNGGRTSRPRIDTQSPETIERAFSLRSARNKIFFLLLKDRTAKEKRALAKQGKPRRAPKMLISAAPTPYPCRLFFEWF